ncbi:MULTISPECIES: helix-turn-helix domain-containing protein [Edwardsiella]|uniref:Transcriptional regulator n=2 Tax=Edwardsiella TaxID=635 RepID=A0A2A7U2K2_EDWTA|nr:MULTISPECIES: helix-turn-helix domain-containing protein [Edwardsiella]ELV7528834.1 XRE family transcriptional regulator [Edwardsiella ictaluri]KMQ77889.1 transcriptional regulator [Edwardsiella ictaluri]KOO54751.1 transcriptional regulator [Edwardsiella ictaluri]PEH72636.1 transcriptional regulator [Edwardsiella tarda]QPW30172.1 XRE family transcriptional regulator [Edwardsiella ictaluri]
MATLDKLLAQRSPESRAKIEARADELRREVLLHQLREELSMSQSELAAAMGVKQPTVARMEQPDNDPRLSTLKRYVTALGGQISIDVTLPTGKRVGFHL